MKAAEWVMGDWTIHDEDRPAQSRKEPYWTLIPGEGGVCLGPFGRKSMDPEYIVSPCGWETDGINIQGSAIAMILNAPTLFALLKEAEGIFARGLQDEHECVDLWSRISDMVMKVTGGVRDE